MCAKKAIECGISTQNIVTFDGFLSSLELRGGPCRASVRKPFSLRCGVWPTSKPSSSPPSPFAEFTKRLEYQILKSNGFGKPYCQTKWIFSSIMAPIKSLIFLKTILTPRWLPTSTARRLRRARFARAGSNSWRRTRRLIPTPSVRVCWISQVREARREVVLHRPHSLRPCGPPRVQGPALQMRDIARSPPLRACGLKIYSIEQ